MGQFNRYWLFWSSNNRYRHHTLHYNENSGLTQAVRKDSLLRYSLSFPNAKKGGYTIQPVKTKTYDYVAKIVKAVVLAPWRRSQTPGSWNHLHHSVASFSVP
ncbi:unnamed protein product [Oncorhynchus mykiss]|uniref:Uncharacterized protein n=1 Tax=Oncorhynchus mykiss TaxID=8022 RepID=A0A060WPW4_ONCMY|nr:unnamed protein product [Oncorhynchus mykiss]